MDEIDAALDFKNVSIVANYIKVSINALNSANLMRLVTIQSDPLYSSPSNSSFSLNSSGPFESIIIDTDVK